MRDVTRCVCGAASTQVQTDEMESVAVDEAALRFDGWEPDADLLQFIRNVSPVMLEQLSRNSVSRAFDGACVPRDGRVYSLLVRGCRCLAVLCAVPTAPASASVCASAVGLLR